MKFRKMLLLLVPVPILMSAYTCEWASSATGEKPDGTCDTTEAKLIAAVKENCSKCSGSGAERWYSCQNACVEKIDTSKPSVLLSTNCQQHCNLPCPIQANNVVCGTCLDAGNCDFNADRCGPCTACFP